MARRHRGLNLQLEWTLIANLKDNSHEWKRCCLYPSKSYCNATDPSVQLVTKGVLHGIICMFTVSNAASSWSIQIYGVFHFLISCWPKWVTHCISLSSNPVLCTRLVLRSMCSHATLMVQALESFSPSLAFSADGHIYHSVGPVSLFTTMQTVCTLLRLRSLFWPIFEQRLSVSLCLLIGTPEKSAY